MVSLSVQKVLEQTFPSISVMRCTVLEAENSFKVTHKVTGQLHHGNSATLLQFKCIVQFLIALRLIYITSSPSLKYRLFEDNCRLRIFYPRSNLRVSNLKLYIQLILFHIFFFFTNYNIRPHTLNS